MRITICVYLLCLGLAGQDKSPADLLKSRWPQGRDESLMEPGRCNSENYVCHPETARILSR